MGRQVIKQPDGNFTVFTSITDTIIGLDMTKQEVIDMFVEEAILSAKYNMENLFSRIENPKYPKSMTFQDALESHIAHIENCKDKEFNAEIIKRAFQEESK